MQIGERKKLNDCAPQPILHEPQRMLHERKIEQFFEHTPKTFDIVYIDACGPLPSADQHTLRMISTLLRHQRLASPKGSATERNRWATNTSRSSSKSGRRPIGPLSSSAAYPKARGETC